MRWSTAGFDAIHDEDGVLEDLVLSEAGLDTLQL
jgi:hypothetical protein